MQFHSRTQPVNTPDHPDSARLEAAHALPSTAWLAAQQAFSERQRAPADQPVVIVRKGRVVALSAAQAAEPQAATLAPAGKPARVFRIVSASAASNPAMQAEPSEPAWQGAAARGGDMPRKKRVAIDRRPGPVLRIVHQLPAMDAGPGIPDEASTMPKYRVSELFEMLAGVDAILDDIRFARSLQFVDAGFESTWAQLSGVAQAIQAQISTR